MVRLATGVEGFDAMVQGGLPRGSTVVLQGDAGPEKRRFALLFLAEGLKAGASALALISSQSPDTVLAELRAMGVDVDAVVRENRLRIVDWYSWTDGVVMDVEDRGVIVRSSIELTSLGVALGRAIASLGGDQPRRAVIEFVSPAMDAHDLTQVYGFAQSAKKKFDRLGFTSLVLVEAETLSTAEITALQQPFDGVIEIERSGSGDQVLRKIRVLSLNETSPDLSFRTLEMTETGMRVGGETSRPSSPASPRGGPSAKGDEDRHHRLELIVQIASERLKHDPNDPDALFAMAAAQATLDDPRGGVQTLERLAELDPNYPGLWVLKTKLHAILGEADRARQSRLRAQQQSDRESTKTSRPPFPCPICDAPVPADAPTCANCGVKFTARTLEDELDELGHAAIQEMVQEELGVKTQREPGQAKPPGKPATKPPTGPPSTPAIKPAPEKGLTNGLVLHRKAGRRASMTNGLRGRTNGLRGRTNGLTNGLGRTNGLTNGLGRTNGLTNGLGRTNGLTNGLGRTNGLTNGLGRTNGLTNGLASGSQSAAFRASSRRGIGRTAGWKLYLIPLVSALLLLLPVFFVPEYQGSPYPIRIDGQFNDWNGVPRLNVTGASGNPNIAIAQVAIADNIDFLAFYMDVRGVALQGDPSPNRITDAFFAFIDADRSPATGYQIQGLGADHLIEIDGWGGQVVRATLFEFNESRDRRDWGGWFRGSSVQAAASGSELEFQAPWLEIVQPKAPIEAAFAARSWDGYQVVADKTATSATPYVLVSQDTAAPQLALGNQSDLARFTLQAVGGDVAIASLNVTLQGTFALSTFSSLALADSGGATLSRVPVTAGRVTFPALTIQVPAGASVNLAVRPAIALNDGTTVGAILANVADVVTRSGGVAFENPAQAPMSLAYVGVIPSAPRIDGGFAEWTNLTTDPTGDVTPIPSSDLDMSQYAFHASSGSVSFFVRVVGTALNGTLVPAANRAYTGNQSGSSNGTRGPPPPPVERGEDFARFYLDQDGSAATGYAIGGIGADYVLEVRGKEGQILSSVAMRFNGSNPGQWSWTALGPAPAGKDRSRIETNLPGVTLTNASRAFITTSGWGGRTDQGTTIRPAFVGIAGLMYSSAYGAGADPTGIIDTSTVNSATGGPSERNVFFDGTNFWAFYFDGTTIQYEPSADGLSWVNTKNAAFTSIGVNRVSTWFYTAGATKIVYIVGDTGAAGNLRVRRGTISGTTITWGTEASVAIANQANNRWPFITRDSSGYLWIASNTRNGNNDFRFAAVRSTSSDNVSTWNAFTDLMNPGIVNDFVQGLVLPLSGGDAYAIWYADGTIFGKRYTASNATWWASTNTIDTTSAGAMTKAPSATVDGSFNIHLVYADSAGAVKYRQRTTSWQAATTLDASSGNTYATITRDTGTGNLYGFYISSTSQTKAQKYSGSWSPVTLETNTQTKVALTSLYNVSSAANVSWVWTQGTASPFNVKFSVLNSGVASRTIDTSTDSTPVSYNNQRKIFFDGSYYWAFYFNGVNSVYTYSVDGLTWENTVNDAFSTAPIVHASVWFHNAGGTKIVYVVGADKTATNSQVVVRRGTINGTAIMWGTQSTAVVSGSNTQNKIAFITRDTNGNLWIASSNQPTPSTYNVGVIKSTNVDDVSAWGAFANLLNTSVSNAFVYPTIVPLSGGNMYALWYADGNIAGKKYTGTWSSQESIDTTTPSVATKIPSAVSDSSDNVHLAYISSTGTVLYRERTSSWSTPTTLNSTSGSTSPTITVVSGSSNLYAFWIAGSYQIKGKQFTGSWTDITLIDTSTIQKGYLTSPYSYSAGSLNFLWDQGGSSPWEVKTQYIPEFQDLLLPTILTGVLVLSLARRRRNRAVRRT